MHSDKLEIIKLENDKTLAMQRAAEILRKYLDSTIDNDESWLVHTLRGMCKNPEPTKKMHSFSFENTIDAAKWNQKVLESYKNDFSLALKHQKDTVMAPGSEFRAINKLKSLWQYRENWSTIAETMTIGAVYPLKNPPDEEHRMKNLLAMIERGNHKSSGKPKLKEALLKRTAKDVRKGYHFTIPIPYLTKLKNAGVIPIGVADQYSINEKGERIPKPRPTHDASFPTPSGYSVNHDHDLDLLTKCFYGQCLRRLIHAIHRARLSFPTHIIYLVKYDLEAAYRRIHVYAPHAVTTITIIKKMAYVLTRLPFGTACGPSRYSDVSEAIFDSANDLLEDSTWEPTKFSPPIANKFDDPETLPKNIPFTVAKDLEVEIPLRETACDGYIDDSITLAVHRNDNLRRAQTAVPLIVDSVFRPVSKNETVEREDAISEIKLKGEGTPSEQKLVLGWLLDTRRLTIHLPTDKALFWTSEIDRLLAQNYRIKSKELESTIGRLNHIGYILPNGRYFLNRLRRLLIRCEKYGPQIPSKPEKEDFILWKHFISHAAQTGVSFNMISFTKPDDTIYTDASSQGMGGYNPATGQAWRFQLQPWMKKSFHINTLEFLASTIGLWLEILNSTTEYKRILALTDNSSAVGWLYKTNFNPETQQKHDIIARKMAKLLLDSDTSIYPQHIPGESNVIADSLSRDFHLSDKTLEFALPALYNTQAPNNLKILKLPTEITCWLESLQGTTINSMESPQAPAPSKMGALLGGNDSLPVVVSKINSWIHSLLHQKSPSCLDSQQLLEEMSKVKQKKLVSQVQQSVKPYRTYVRFSKQTFVGPQSLMMMEKSLCSSNDK